MKLKLRVAAVLASATALAGTGVIMAAMPASAVTVANYSEICSGYSGNTLVGDIAPCLYAPSPGDGMTVQDPDVYSDTIWVESAGTISYSGETYHQIRQYETNYCLEWDDSGGYVTVNTCNSNVEAQWWWVSWPWGNGDPDQTGKLRNYYSELNNEPACLYYNSATEGYSPTVASCSSDISDWFSG